MAHVEVFPFQSRRRRPWRRIAKIASAPFYFMLESGQFESMWRARATDRRGNPIPMFTYPAFDFLRSIESGLRDAEVLEFGCGQSTKWFAPRVARLIGVEKNPSFREALKRDFAGNPKVTIIGNELPFAVEGAFDIIVVDGEPRLQAAEHALTHVKPDGIVIFDNSDVESLHAIPQAFHDAGFGRVDFFGYSPTGVRKQGTSIFFRTLDWFRKAPIVMPISTNSVREQLK